MYKEDAGGKSHVFKGKKKSTRAWESQWIRHTWQCRLPQPRTLSESCSSVLTILHRNSFALDGYMTGSAAVHRTRRHFTQWGLFQAGSALTYRALTKHCAHCCPFRDSVTTKHGAAGPLWIVITASARGQALHVLKHLLENCRVVQWEAGSIRTI